MECINYFHDYIIILLSIILFFVVYLFLKILIIKKLDKITLDSHSLEIIWTISPIILLLFIAYPSLLILYYIEAIEERSSNFSLKVIAHQWYWEYEINKDFSFEDNLKLNPVFFFIL